MKSRVFGCVPKGASGQDAPAARDSSPSPGCFVLNEVSGSPRQRTIIVLGLARGGTSLVAGCLRLLGVDMGDQVAQGIHEDLDFVGNNLDKIRSAIASRNKRKDLWGWKNTTNLLVLPHIFPLLRNPQVICITRDVISLVARNTSGAAFDLRTLIRQTISHYQWLLFSAMSLPCPVLFVSYEKARLNSENVIKEIARFVGVDPTPETLEKAKNFVSDTYHNVWMKNAATLNQTATTAEESEKFPPGVPIRFFPNSNVVWRDDMFFSMGKAVFQLVFPDSLRFPGKFQLSFNLKSAGTVHSAGLIFDFGEGLIAEPRISLPGCKPGINSFVFSLNEKPYFVQFDLDHLGGHYLIDDFTLAQAREE